MQNYQKLNYLKLYNRFFSRLFGPFMKVGLLVVKNIVTSLVKSVLLSLGLTAVGSVIDIGIHKKFRPGTYGFD